MSHSELEILKIKLIGAMKNLDFFFTPGNARGRCINR